MSDDNGVINNAVFISAQQPKHTIYIYYTSIL